jgi:hypothetical protein
LSRCKAREKVARVAGKAGKNKKLLRKRENPAGGDGFYLSGTFGRRNKAKDLRVPAQFEQS